MGKDIISEIDLLPKGIKSSPAKTAWEALSNGLVNIQQAMKYRETEKVPDAHSAENGRTHVITPKDVEEIVGYIKLTVNNCLSSTLPDLMLKETKSNKNMKKNTIKLNESQLRDIVAESVKIVLKEEGEGIEMMGSVPSESYGKYGNLMEKLDEVGDIEITRILHDCEKHGMDNKMLIRINDILYSFKGTLIHALDTRYW